MKYYSETPKIRYIELRLILFQKNKILKSMIYFKVANLDE